MKIKELNWNLITMSGYAKLPSLDCTVNLHDGAYLYYMIKGGNSGLNLIDCNCGDKQQYYKIENVEEGKFIAKDLHEKRCKEIYKNLFE